MTTFECGGLAELFVLYRAVLAGKFCECPQDSDLMASPILAAMARDLSDVVASYEAANAVTDIGHHQQSRLSMHSGRAEWAIAVAYARKYLMPKWHGWTPEERSSVVGDLIAPFTFGPNEETKFIEAVTFAQEQSR
jgi:hypothetical protein